MTDAFVRALARVSRAPTPVFDLDPRHTAAAPVVRRIKNPGRSRSALLLAGARVADPRRGQRADRFLAALPPQQAEPQGRVSIGAPVEVHQDARILSALQRRRPRGGAAARRRHGRERRDGGAPRQSPRADPHALRRQGALRRLHARRGHRHGWIAAARCCSTCRPAASTSTTTGSIHWSAPNTSPGERRLLINSYCRRRLRQPRVRTPPGLRSMAASLRGTWPAVARRTGRRHADAAGLQPGLQLHLRSSGRSRRRRREDVARRARRGAEPGTQVRRARRVARLDNPGGARSAPIPLRGLGWWAVEPSAARSPRRE